MPSEEPNNRTLTPTRAKSTLKYLQNYCYLQLPLCNKVWNCKADFHWFIMFLVFLDFSNVLCRYISINLNNGSDVPTGISNLKNS